MEPRKETDSLQTLLARIDRGTAPFLEQDFLRQRATKKKIRKKKPFIVFLLGKEETALPIEVVQEIGKLPTSIPLPHLPPWIPGIIQLRGEILSVVDFHLLFGLQEISTTSDALPFLLFHVKGFKFCLPVEKFIGVINVNEQNAEGLKPVDQGTDPENLAFYIRGVLEFGERKINIFDSNRLAESVVLRNWRQHMEAGRQSAQEEQGN
ncbi:MAG: hypothetical protein CSA34_02505 [Desulfobulbus propionicus]|nr:MAG: hypothetical protein CSA34_02505 [Desulfobulbus propionicus]